MSVPSWARVGAKVVCVNAVESRCMLVADQIYTVKSVNGFSGSGRLRISLFGVEDTAVSPPGWYADRFRPLVTRTQAQDVRAIKSMLRELPAETRLDRLLEALDE